MSSTTWIAGLLRAAPAIGCLLASVTGSGVAAADCDRNGIPDDVDIASGTSPDCDSNGVPDACDLAPTWLGPVGPRHVFLPGTPSCATLADLDLDGILDAAVACYDSGRVAILRGCGDGTFGEPVLYPAGRSLNSMASGDWNSDGFLDLAACSGHLEQVFVFLGNGDGSFLSATAFPTGANPLVLVARDFDLDGDLDLVTGSDYESPWNISMLPGDGAVDVVVPIDDPPEIVILRGDGTGSFLAPIRYTVPGYPLRASAGDVDGDGDIDLFVLAAGRPHLYFLVAGPPAAPFEVRELPTGNDSVDCAILVDLDGDGIVDVAAGGTGVVGIFRGNGDGTFRDRSPVPVGDPADESVVALAASDLDRDGRLDLAAALRLDGYDASRRDRIAVLRGTGGGALGPPEYRFVRLSPREIVVTDLDGDGIGDLGVANSQSSSISLLPGNGDATFGPEICVPVSQGAESIAAGDFDEDAFGDLAVASLGWGESTRGAVSLVLGRRAPPALADCDSNGVPDSCDIASGAASDVDSDGIPDRCEGGLRVPGDCNEDGVTNISDASCTLGVLFLGTPPEFPCGDGGPGDPGNAALLGWQGSASVSVSDAIGLLRFLFLDGPPHPAAAPVAPAATCVPFAGCTSSAGCR